MVPPLAPGMKESVDKCTKKTEIQSQKWQYEIAHMYNFVRKNSSHHPQKWIIQFDPCGIIKPLPSKDATKRWHGYLTTSDLTSSFLFVVKFSEHHLLIKRRHSLGSAPYYCHTMKKLLNYGSRKPRKFCRRILLNSSGSKLVSHGKVSSRKIETALQSRHK